MYKSKTEFWPFLNKDNTDAIYDYDYNLGAIKYYKMAIKEGDIEAMYNLAILYKEEDNITEAIKYYKMAIEKGYKEAICDLAMLYEKENKELKDENQKLKDKIKRIKTKIKYMPGNIGYKEAEEDFNKLCKK